MMYLLRRRNGMGELSERSRPIVEVKNLRKEYRIGDEVVVALKKINLSIMRGNLLHFRNVRIGKKHFS